MPEKMTLHFHDGSTADIDAIDARRVLREHPSEWSTSPFPADVQEKAKKAINERRSAILKIRTSGRPQHEIEQAIAELDELHRLEKEDADKVARSGRKQVKTEKAEG
ncbi:hypothetical protein MRS76_11235 [Rhizobiaceae bacterium n13]|uniref:hypothetical protein n=1 Tax=Ferirhizobium litorale TaxID=2927786 RepID=UPI0024B2F8BA|nr:hypothetical protein [Fererhizobium litorale]MDI7862534.1 hypothetical protein [Fererhizobium litorale]